MKYNKLLVLPVLALMFVGCSKKTSSSSSISSTDNDPVSNINVTLNVNVSGIDSYTGAHSVIYINSSFEKDGSNWVTKPLTQSSTNANLWTVTFENVEVDCNYQYNFVYGNETEPDWSNGFNTEGSGETPRSIRITEASSTVGLSASFNVPTTAYSFKIILNPTIIDTDGNKKEDLYDSTVVKMWCSSSSLAVFEKQEDGTWTYDVTNYLGSSFGITPILETESSCTWSHQYGTYVDGTWEKWNATYINLPSDLTEEDGSYTLVFNASFASQPDEII